jgi:2-methylcitrate dehydratase PrpD
VDDNIGEASADIVVAAKDGRKLHVFVEHAIGSMQRPMSDADLARKFHGLVDPVLGTASADRLLNQCAALAGAADVRALAALAREPARD